MRNRILFLAAILMTPLPRRRARCGCDSSERDSLRDDPAGRAMLKNVAAAHSEITRVLSDLRRSFEESSELRDARKPLRAAQASYKATTDAG